MNRYKILLSLCTYDLVQFKNCYGIINGSAGCIYKNVKLIKCVYFLSRVTDYSVGYILENKVATIKITCTSIDKVVNGGVYNILESDVYSFNVMDHNRKIISLPWCCEYFTYDIIEMLDQNIAISVYKTNYHVRRLSWFIKFLNWIKGK